MYYFMQPKWSIRMLVKEWDDLMKMFIVLKMAKIVFLRFSYNLKH